MIKRLNTFTRRYVNTMEYWIVENETNIIRTNN